MVNTVLRAIFRFILSLRYRIKVVGLKDLAEQDERGILFLPNHPALIDPFILLCYLTSKFKVRPIAGRAQIDKPGIRWLASRVQVRKMPDAHEQGEGPRHEIASMLRQTARALNSGEALVFYPAGRIYRRNQEDLGNNGGVSFLLRSCPNTRVVLVRTTGLWGSSFSRAGGNLPTVARAAKRGFFGMLVSGFLFLPRRQVTIEFSEPTDIPRHISRERINRYLETHYNAVPQFNTYVPYSIWEQGKTRVVPEVESTSE
jgi:long-chain-fatty-acid--[acyl-carrier-protein] ligase